MRLRDYEREWLARVRRSTARRVLIVGPTGCGKTVVASHLIRERVRAREPVLFVVHRRELVLQAVQRLREVGVAERDIGVNVGDPQALGLVARLGALVQVASVQTLAKREPAQWPAAKLVIVDEAHHAPAPSYQALVGHYRDAQAYGLTATPYRMDGAPLGTLFDEIVQSAPPSELVAAGWIVKPAVYTVPESHRPDLADVPLQGRDYHQGELARAVNRRHLVGSIIEHWQRHALGRAAVCFAVNVEHGEHITREFQAHGVAAELVTGETAPRERADVLARVRAGATRVIVNCAVYTEGWDAPEVKLAIIARPTMSRALWMQMAGRITRPHEHTPIVLDHAGNAIVHGVPLEDETFSLHAALVRRKRHGNVAEKACPTCGNNVAVGARVCGFCAHEFWQVGLPEEEAGRLVLAQGGARFCQYDKCPRPNVPVSPSFHTPKTSIKKPSGMHRECRSAAARDGAVFCKYDKCPRPDEPVFVGSSTRRIGTTRGMHLACFAAASRDARKCKYEACDQPEKPCSAGREMHTRCRGLARRSADRTCAQCGGTFPRSGKLIRAHCDACRAAKRAAARQANGKRAKERWGTAEFQEMMRERNRSVMAARQRKWTPRHDTRGRQLLLGAVAGAAELGRRLDKPLAASARWFSGSSIPGAAARALLERVLGIPVAAWELTPTGKPTTRATRQPEFCTYGKCPRPSMPIKTRAASTRKMHRACWRAAQHATRARCQYEACDQPAKPLSTRRCTMHTRCLNRARRDSKAAKPGRSHASAARLALIRTVASRRRVGLCAVCVCAPCVCARPPLEQCLGG